MFMLNLQRIKEECLKSNKEVKSSIVALEI
jgi:hypothetical protein